MEPCSQEPGKLDGAAGLTPDGAMNPEPSSRPSRWEWALAGLLAANLGATLLANGGYGARFEAYTALGSALLFGVFAVSRLSASDGARRSPNAGFVSSHYRVSRPLGRGGVTPSVIGPPDGVRPLPSPPAPHLAGLASAPRPCRQGPRPQLGRRRRESAASGEKSKPEDRREGE